MYYRLKSFVAFFKKNIIENLTFGEETCRKTKRLLIFYKSEVSFIWRDLGTKYSRIKGKNPHT